MTKEHEHSYDISILSHYYGSLLEKHGDGPEAVQWTDRDTQEQRMKILAEVGVLQSAKVLDFGCGTGHLFEYLNRHFHFNGEYVGYDICPKMIDTAARKYPHLRFEQRDVLSDPPRETFDYILLNGVFNNMVSDNWHFLTTILTALFPFAAAGLAFNALTTYVDYFDQGLFYVSPEKVFRFCKEELSPCVTLRHDYTLKRGVPPYDFAVYVYQCGLRPRKRLRD